MRPHTQRLRLHAPRSAIAVARSIDQLLLAAFFIALLSLSAAHAQSGAPRLVRPAEATAGALLLPSTQDGLYVAAPMLAADVAIEVSGPIKRTRVTATAGSRESTYSLCPTRRRSTP